MSSIGIILGAAWAVLLAVWLVRLPVERLYRPTPGLLTWLGARVLLRLGVGVFGVLWWESLRLPEPPPFSVLIVQSNCPEAWAEVEKAFQLFHARGVRVALLVAEPQEAYWAIPPTRDSSICSTIGRALRATAPERASRAAAAPVWAQLRPYRERIIEGVWIGNFDSLPTPAREWSHWISACGPILSREGYSILTRLSDFQPVGPPLSQAQIYSLLTLGCGLVLLGLEVGLYVFRYYLPLRPAQDCIR